MDLSKLSKDELSVLSAVFGSFDQGDVGSDLEHLEEGAYGTYHLLSGLIKMEVSDRMTGITRDPANIHIVALVDEWDEDGNESEELIAAGGEKGITKQLKTLGLPLAFRDSGFIFVDSDDTKLLSQAKQIPGIKSIKKNQKEPVEA